MYFKTHLLLWGLVVLFLTPGCTESTKQAISCDELRQPDLQEFIRTHPNQDQFADWVEGEYQTPDLEFSTGGSLPPEVIVIKWQDQGRGYYAKFDGEDLQFIESDLDTTATTIASTLDCLGTPPTYSARMFSGMQGLDMTVTLWYPESGVVVLYSPEGRVAERDSIDQDFPAYGITYLPTTTLDDGFNTLYQYHSEETQQDWYADLAEWPDDIESVEVELSK